MPGVPANDGQPTELLELAARAEVSDVGAITLELVELSVDRLAQPYSRMPPDALLRDVRTRARQTGSLLDRRATLAQRRRLRDRHLDGASTAAALCDV